jgi:SAM-dependent methyltransferase
VEHGEPLGVAVDGGGVTRAEDARALECARGCRVPVVGGIPRFVGSENYAAGFGIQWNAFKQTQLDSHNGTTIFRDRLTRCLGGSLEAVRDKTVLEVGCGAGPFTEVLLSAGARVFAIDLSSAVEANYENNSRSPNYFVCQASALNAPVAPASFDVVVCLGVVQHTPDPEQTVAALAGYVAPGGMLVIDHYSYNYPYPLSRRVLRPVLIRLPAALSTKLAMAVGRAVLPLHKFSLSRRRGMWRLRRFLLRHSPLVDHFGDYPELGEELVGEWSVLNTHDTLTDRYKHLRSAEEIARCLSACGLVDIEVSYGGNGVEARARKPAEAGARERVAV